MEFRLTDPIVFDNATIVRPSGRSPRHDEGGRIIEIGEGGLRAVASIAEATICCPASSLTTSKPITCRDRASSGTPAAR